MGIKQTAGPWVLGESSGGRHFRAVNATDHSELATVVWVMEDDDMEGAQSPECEANARLICAAPDLLEALADAVIDFDNWAAHEDNHPHEHLVAWAEKARAAIAKAKGEEQ